MYTYLTTCVVCTGCMPGVAHLQTKAAFAEGAPLREAWHVAVS